MNPSALKPVPRSSLSDGIVRQILMLIDSGTLRPGDRMPAEKQLCVQFGVGRTSVREALKSLAVMGLVEARAGDGTFVLDGGGRHPQRVFQWGLLLDPKVTADLIETRVMLESGNASLAAEKASPADIARMTAALKGMKAAVADPAAYLEQDLLFHEAVAQATHNSILRSLLSTTRAYLQEWIARTLAQGPAPERARKSIAEHGRILRAIAARDPGKAWQAMAAHILSSSRDLGGA
ncbi:MAG: FadR family transcriptional regulator [Acidobacteria bacterium]|nr:FadR family transcriptional regulator [Acidobacteriota bacterium]